MKPITWIGDSLQVVRGFARVARQRIGFQLGRVQQGLEPQDWKPMSTIGPGVKEIRVHADNEYRVIYVAVFRSCIYVLHAFVKKTRKTAPSDVALARVRYREVRRSEERKK